MFRPYRTLKIKVPRPCCPWCQAHSERVEQKLQALEKEILDLATSLANATENPLAKFPAALQVLGLASNLHSTIEGIGSQSTDLARGFTAIIAALHRLADVPNAQAPLAASRPETLPPLQLPQNGADPKGLEAHLGVEPV